ncbi:hypothetical protein [Bradyrhizobium sp. LTSP857]|uniref:hypothetical protein n=1 Tax=Bradyrhizobium sp. LTSP857 TaxID=1619231 RepID=UPI001FD91C4A|nr:hypothetical protein [Bradyrhizobium sp. LTSP857]
MNDILIRPATEQDADLIAAIHASSWRDAYAHILAPEFLNGAIEADRLAVWSQRLRDRSTTQLINVACDPAGLVQGKRSGSSLLRAAWRPRRWEGSL